MVRIVWLLYLIRLGLHMLMLGCPGSIIRNYTGTHLINAASVDLRIMYSNVNYKYHASCLVEIN